jgi:hypothetical protein
MPRVSKTPLRPIRKPGRFRNPIVAWTGGDLCVSVCGFDFVFRDRNEAAIYLQWFEQYEKQHRRQFNIIGARPSLRNRLVKLPAHLFKTQNRPKVIKALRAAVDGGG